MDNSAVVPVSDLPSFPYWRHEGYNNLVYCLEGMPIHYVFEGRFATAALQEQPRYLLLKVRKLELQEGCNVGLRDISA